MAMNEANLGLEVDEAGGTPVLRVVVEWVRGYAPKSGAPLISDPCNSIPAFEREIDRLREELSALLEDGCGRLGGKPGAKTANSAEAPPKRGENARLATDLRVQDVMSENVRVVGPNDPLSVADELMKQGRFRHAVVVGDGDLVGILSQRDIFYGALAWSLGRGERAHEQTLSTMPVKQVMNTNVQTVEPESPLSEAATRMQVGCLPVMAGRKLVGILTEGDFLALLAA